MWLKSAGLRSASVRDSGKSDVNPPALLWGSDSVSFSLVSPPHLLPHPASPLLSLWLKPG